MLNTSKYQFIEVKKKCDRYPGTRHYCRFSTDSKGEAEGRFKRDLLKGKVWANLLTADHAYSINTDDIESWRWVPEEYIKEKLKYFSTK